MWIIKFSDITNQMNLVKNKIIIRSHHFLDTSVNKVINLKSISTGCSQGPLFTFGQQIRSASVPAQLFNYTTASTSQPSCLKFIILQDNHHQDYNSILLHLWLTIINTFLFQGYITWCRLHDLSIKHVTQNSICLNHKSVSTIMNASARVLSQRASRYGLGAIKLPK